MPRHTPLTPREIITDSTLRRLMDDTCGTRRTGRLSAEDAALMAMILPDLCGELVTLRALARHDDSQCGVKTAALRRLAIDTPERGTGTLCVREHRYLALTLPAICRELLDRRIALTCGEAA